jgi:hypothetical protein
MSHLISSAARSAMPYTVAFVLADTGPRLTWRQPYRAGPPASTLVPWMPVGPDHLSGATAPARFARGPIMSLSVGTMAHARDHPSGA